MRSFFWYFGSKMNLAQYYGPPRRSIVVEPFAGSACYATYWNAEIAKLYDIDEDICSLWDFLIHCSEQDIKGLPDYIQDADQIAEFTPANHLIRRWIWFGVRIKNSTSLKLYHNKIKNGNICVWSPVIKYRIIQQKPRIKKWTIECKSYKDVPNGNYHWHIDPPYDGVAGSEYTYGRDSIDYHALAKFCVSRQGAVDVCEQQGARWLDFEPLIPARNSRARWYNEVIWSKNKGGLF